MSTLPLKELFAIIDDVPGPLAEAVLWVLLTTKKRRHRRRRQLWQWRTFRGGTYGPRDR